jgi:hypothetical protein
MKKSDFYLMLISLILIMELICLYVKYNEFEKGVKLGYNIGLKECKRLNNHPSTVRTVHHNSGLK